MYNKSFRVGLILTLILWMVVNIVAHHIARVDYDATGIKWVVHGSTRYPYDWGFPFYWTEAGGFFANAVVVALTSIVGGHISRILYESFSSTEK